MAVNNNDKQKAYDFGKSQGGRLSSDNTRMIHNSFNWGISGGSIVTNKGDRYSTLNDFEKSKHFKK